MKLSEKTRDEIKQQWCKYVTKAEASKMRSAKTETHQEIYQAIRAFQERGRRLKDNQGERIFLRS